MSYFSHGDTITTANLNALVNAINSIETQTGFNTYVLGGRDALIAGTVFHGVHTRRWLIYRSTGEIRDFDDPTNEEKITVLPDCNAPFCVFDTHTIPWLKYGMMYEIEGTEFALETDVNA